MNDEYLHRLRDMQDVNPTIPERLLHIINKIDPTKINVILNIGSVDGWIGTNLAFIFHHAQVHTFDPVRYNIETCNRNRQTTRLEVQNRTHLHQLALNDTTGPMKFWELDEFIASKKGRVNRAISSKYKLIDPVTAPWEYSQQHEVTLNGHRIDDWCSVNSIESVNAIYMSVNGAELDILRGAGRFLENVQFIITEASITPYYQNQNLLHELDAFLKQQGFVEWLPARRFVNSHNVDVIYLNTNFATF